MTDSCAEGDSSRWLALQPPVWVPILWWLTLATTIVASMAGDPGAACTVAQPCEPDAAFSVVVALAGASAAALWWAPVTSLVLGAGFAAVSAALDPSIPGRYAATVALAVALGLAAFVRSLRIRQAEVAAQLFPVGSEAWMRGGNPALPGVASHHAHPGAGRTSAELWIHRAAGVVGILLLAGSVVMYARSIAAEQAHRDRAHTVVGVVVSDWDDDFRQAFHIEGQTGDRVVRIETIDVLDRGTRWPILVDPADPTWARLVSEPADFTAWLGWGIVGLVAAGWAAGREICRLRVRGPGTPRSSVMVRPVAGRVLELLDSRAVRGLADLPVAGPTTWRSRGQAEPAVVHGRLAGGNWVALQTRAGFASVAGPLRVDPRWRLPEFVSRRGSAAADPVTGIERAWDRLGAAGRVVWQLGAVALGCLLLWLGVVDVGPSWAAARGHGTPGQVTVTSEDCSGRGGCDYYGDWSSADGTRRFTDVNIVGGGGDVGSTVPAFAEGDDPAPDAVYAPGWSGFGGALFMTGMGLGVGGHGLAGLAAPWFLRRQTPGRHASDR